MNNELFLSLPCTENAQNKTPPQDSTKAKNNGKSDKNDLSLVLPLILLLMSDGNDIALIFALLYVII